jgi:hypothetical protein
MVLWIAFTFTLPCFTPPFSRHSAKRAIPQMEADPEAIVVALKLSTARVRRLAAAVEAEEAALVQAALMEAEVMAAARGSSSTASAARHTEQQLEARVRRTSQLLQEETQKLQASLQSHDSQKLALAVEQGVDDYYDDLRTMRRERRAVAGVGGDPGTMVRRLREEERRLDDAVRSLRAEIDALEADEMAAVEQRRALVKALHRRERGAREARY